MFRSFAWLLLLGSVACGSAAHPAPPSSAATAGQADQAGWLFRQGMAAADRGDSVRAEQYLSLARERGYPQERVLPVLLRVCLANTRLRAALDYAEQYLRQHPEQDALRFLVASIHVGLGQQEAALSELDSLLRRSPSFEEAHFLRAGLVADKAPADAIEALRQYLDLAPRGLHAAEARNRLSELLARSEVGSSAGLSTERALP